MVSQPPTSPEPPPGHQGLPAASASSSADNTAETKTTEPTVPVFKQEEEPVPASYRDDVNMDSEKAEELEQEVGESAKEEVKAEEQGNTWYANLEQAKEESESEK